MTETIQEYALQHWTDFSDLFRFKTIAAQHIGIKETSDWIAKQFKQLGANNVEIWNDQGGNPVIFAKFKGNSDKTVLFYNHYDTQPAEPLDQWDTDPFKPTVKNDRLFVRGADDDKGELLFRLVYLKYCKEHGGLPVNVKFYVEGEEEIGSSHVIKYTQAHADQLNADAVIWEGGAKNADGKLSITGGLRGISCLELSVATANVDLHSSLASYAESAPWRLTKALATLRDDNDGKILIDGIYDDVDQLSDKEKSLLNKLSFDANKISKVNGLTRPLLTDHPLVALSNEPTITINGITSGYQEEGVKTVLPRFASAKLDFRLAPSQNPTRVPDLVRKQLAKNGFPDIKVKYLVGQPGYRSDVDHPFVKLVCDAASQVYGSDGYEYQLNSFGAGPAYAFGDLLKLPVVSFGLGNADSHVHGANENIRLSDAQQTLVTLDRLLKNFA